MTEELLVNIVTILSAVGFASRHVISRIVNLEVSVKTLTDRIDKFPCSKAGFQCQVGPEDSPLPTAETTPKISRPFGPTAEETIGPREPLFEVRKVKP